MVADEIGCSPAQLAIQWVMRGRGVIVPLVGARTREQLDDNLGCLDVEISDDHRGRLEEASAIRMGFPHDMLAQMGARNVINHRER